MNENKGIVYVMRNPSVWGFKDAEGNDLDPIIKIGYVQSSDVEALEKRRRSLSSASVPFAFEIVYAKIVDNAHDIEQKLHDIFDGERVSSNREFFYTSSESVKAALSLVNGVDITPSQEDGITDEDKTSRKKLDDILESKSTRRENFTFGMLDIAPGTILTFKGNEAITAIVLDNNNNIEYNGEKTTISGAANKIIRNKTNNPGATRVSGSLHWIYNGKTLDELRSEKELELSQNEDE